MIRLKAHNLWIFSGAEAKQASFRDKPVRLDGWYVGHAEGGEIQSGPHRSAGAAEFDAYAMTDTSGT